MLLHSRIQLLLSVPTVQPETPDPDQEAGKRDGQRLEGIAPERDGIAYPALFRNVPCCPALLSSTVRQDPQALYLFCVLLCLRSPVRYEPFNERPFFGSQSSVRGNCMCTRRYRRARHVSLLAPMAQRFADEGPKFRWNKHDRRVCSFRHEECKGS
jgi:hypothetical protein